MAFSVQGSGVRALRFEDPRQRVDAVVAGRSSISGRLSDTGLAAGYIELPIPQAARNRRAQQRERRTSPGRAAFFLRFVTDPAAEHRRANMESDLGQAAEAPGGTTKYIGGCRKISLARLPAFPDDRIRAPMARTERGSTFGPAGSYAENFLEGIAAAGGTWSISRGFCRQRRHAQRPSITISPYVPALNGV